MKELYTKPEFDIDAFKTVDVITTSNETDDRRGDDNPLPWGA